MMDMGGEGGSPVSGIMGGGESSGAASAGEKFGGGESGGGGSTSTWGTGDAVPPATTGQGGSGGGALSQMTSDSMVSNANANKPPAASPQLAGASMDASTAPINSQGSKAGGDISSIGAAMSGSSEAAGAAAGTTPKQSMASKLEMEIGKSLKGTETEKAQSAPAPVNMNNTYGVLFGTPQGSQANINQRGNAPPMQMQTPTIQPPPPVAPIQPPQMVNQMQAPAPMQLAVSDINAKMNIRDADGSINRFLENVYANVIKKGKR